MTYTTFAYLHISDQRFDILFEAELIHGKSRGHRIIHDRAGDFPKKIK